ncbi:hypothetical protein C8J57DRAFT_1528774 [Mycena rebaudengoi]|nr:hypothetical protein C8J57DRAFT_1528774 [Mycena rebaudengoi]
MTLTLDDRCCVPSFYPNPRHTDTAKHSAAHDRFFYGVIIGNMHGIYTSWDSAERSMKDFPGARYVTSPTWDGVQDLWKTNCAEFHTHAVPSPSVPNCSVVGTPVAGSCVVGLIDSMGSLPTPPGFTPAPLLAASLGNLGLVGPPSPPLDFQHFLAKEGRRHVHKLELYQKEQHQRLLEAERRKQRAREEEITEARSNDVRGSVHDSAQHQQDDSDWDDIDGEGLSGAEDDYNDEPEYFSSSLFLSTGMGASTLSGASTHLSSLTPTPPPSAINKDAPVPPLYQEWQLPALWVIYGVTGHARLFHGRSVALATFLSCVELRSARLLTMRTIAEARNFLWLEEQAFSSGSYYGVTGISTSIFTEHEAALAEFAGSGGEQEELRVVVNVAQADEFLALEAQLGALVF